MTGCPKLSGEISRTGCSGESGGDEHLSSHSAVSIESKLLFDVSDMERLSLAVFPRELILVLRWTTALAEEEGDKVGLYSTGSFISSRSKAKDLSTNEGAP